MMINLHIYSIFSDGAYYVEEIKEIAQKLDAQQFQLNTIIFVKYMSISEI